MTENAYDLDQQSLLYATVAKGFRLGGTTGPVSGIVCKGDLEAVGISNTPTSYGPTSSGATRPA